MSDLGIPLGFGCSRPWLRDIAWFIAETARPMSIWLVSMSIAWRYAVDHTNVDVGSLTVMAGTLTLLYGAKVTEKAIQARAEADVQKAQAKQPQGATP